MIVNNIMPLDGGAMSRDEPVRYLLVVCKRVILIYMLCYICFSPSNQGSDAQW